MSNASFATVRRTIDLLVPSTRRATVAAWTGLLLFHLFLPLLLSRSHENIPDEDAYQDLARSLATTGQFALDHPSFRQLAGAPNSYYAPGWPALLALGYRAVGGPTGFWIVLGLVWCAALALVDWFGRTLGLRGAARWGLLLWMTTNPMLLYYHGHLMTEPATIALGAALLAAGIRWITHPSVRAVALLAVLSGVSHLIRTTLLLPVLAVMTVGLFTLPMKRFIPLAAVFAAIHLAILSPWLVRMDHIHAGGHSTELKLGSNLFTYNNIHVDNPYQLRPGESFEEPANLEEMTPEARDKTLTKLALQGIERRPDLYIRNCLRRVRYLFSPTPNFVQASGIKIVAVALTTLAYFYASWVILVGAVVKGSRPTRAEWVVLLAVGLWYAFHILLHGSVRQRLPSDVWVAALALALCAREVRVPRVATPAERV